MLKRLIGIIMILVGIGGIAISVGGLTAGLQAVDRIGLALEESLRLTAESLDAINETLQLTKSSTAQVSVTIDTVAATSANVSQTISTTSPLLDQVTQVTTEDLPNSVEAIQNAIPNAAATAKTIDDTLHALSAFQAERRIFGVPVSFDLGIDYDPEAPFNEALLEIGTSLDGVSSGLRSLESNMEVTADNLDVVGENLQTISEDLEQINNNLAELEPMIDGYISLATETSDLIRQTRANLDQQLTLAKRLLTFFFVWLALVQIVPLYLGWELFSDKREPVSKTMSENVEDSPPPAKDSATS
jgi:ABC-type transporter Mla subunit MlaD